MAERISTYELGKMSIQLQNVLDEMQLLTSADDFFEVYERINPSGWKFRGGQDAIDCKDYLQWAIDAINRMSDLKR